MCKESLNASICKCGMRIQWMEYHWPNCPENPAKSKLKVMESDKK